MTSHNKKLLTKNDEAVSRINNAGFVNAFQNDGSFLEMFKKMQNASQNETGSNGTTMPIESEEIRSLEREKTQSLTLPASKPPPAAFIGRRKCSKALPVGKVKKLKTEKEEKKQTTTDAWAKYLEEVKKYKETYCDSEAKNRSLVK